MVIPLGMVFPFGRRRPNSTRVLLDRLYDEIVGAVRRPVFYLDLAVPDTFEGRFELLVLHAGLVLRRFNHAEAPGPAIAQDLVDAVFAHLEADLREAGVGDITVPKRMKKLCEAFLGRSAAYDAGLGSGIAALTAVVERNVYAGRSAGRAAEQLSRYAEAAAAALASTPLEACLADPLPFPDPFAFLFQSSP